MSNSTLDITGRACQYVPYTMLERSPVTLRLGKAPIHITLSSSHACLVSVSPLFLIKDSENESESETVLSVVVKLGTSFLLTYNGDECEVRLGRRIMVKDADVPSKDVSTY